MISRNVAEYVANVRYKTDLKSLKRAQKFISALENKFTRTVNNSVNKGLVVDPRTFSKKINRVIASQPIEIKISSKNLKVDKTGIRRSLNEAVASSVLDNRAIIIKNFKVDQTALNRVLTEAINAKTSYRVGVKPVFNNIGLTGDQGTRQSGRSKRSPFWERQLTQRTPNTSLLMTGTVLTGGFGLKELNKQVQDWTMLETKMTAVIGDVEKAQAKIENLKRLGQNIGSNPLELANSYVQMLASAQGTGFEPHLDKGFGTFTRYGKVMGLDEEAMKGSMRAVNQMLSKQQIMAEELRGQLAERLPAAVRLMADAVADGDTAKLNKMMEKGELDPNVVLPKFFAMMQKAVDRGWDKYTQSSRFHQGKARSALGILTDVFGRNGGERGFVNSWRSLQEALNASQPAAKLLAEKFYDLSKQSEQLSNIVKLVNEAIEKNQGKLLNDNFWLIIKALGVLYTRFSKLIVLAIWLTDVIEDLASWAKGGQSVLKDMFDSLKKLDFKGVMENLKALFSEEIVELGKVVLALFLFRKVLGYVISSIPKLISSMMKKKVVLPEATLKKEKNTKGKNKGKRRDTRPVDVSKVKPNVTAKDYIPLAPLAATGVGALALGMGAAVYTNTDEMKVAYGGDPWANAFFLEQERQKKQSDLNNRLYMSMMERNPDFVDMMNAMVYSQGNVESGFMDMINRVSVGSTEGLRPAIENINLEVNVSGNADGRQIGREIVEALSKEWSMVNNFMPVGG